MENYQYTGNELEVFALAKHWKKYIKDQLSPFMGSNILEVGCGSGNNTKNLHRQDINSWLCIEPDKSLVDQLREKINTGILPSNIETIHGIITDLPTSRKFDSIIYIDVLEHIEDDKREIEIACSFLKEGGRLIILVPAFQTLYSNFDKKIGHFRRYKKKSLQAVLPAHMLKEKLCYLDSASMIVSFAARLFNKSGDASLSQIKVWDNIFVPFSRFTDPLLAFSIGKSLVGVWKKQ